MNPIHDKNAQESRDRNTGVGKHIPIHFFFLKKRDAFTYRRENEAPSTKRATATRRDPCLPGVPGPLSPRRPWTRLPGVPAHKEPSRGVQCGCPSNLVFCRLGPRSLSCVIPTSHLTWRPFACRSSCQGPLTTPCPLELSLQHSRLS